ncbi:MAG TPA: PhnD/SsuA/transferrin family substrate-binding protein, partial [Planctomycetota bacterium]|nr:PhnD/SsuA/transferrin family substrate-binding protein [Planctomycetota bacterium]
DFAWLGGVTAVEAEAATDGQAVFLAARESDLHFKSYVVVQREHVDSGRFRELALREPQPLSELAALAPALAQGTFSFGAKSSTSGHIMPRHFLESPQVAIDPETDFLRPAGYQLQGGHSATLAAVASGVVDAGVLNFASWEAADADSRARAPVVYVTPEYVDYCLVGHARLGETLCARLRDAFTGLDAADPREAAVLAAFSTERFVAADPSAWDGIRAVLASARARGVLD